MTIYVAHSPYDQKARKCLDVVTDLQNRFPEHTFVCNVLAFWHLYADTPGEKLYNIISIHPPRVGWDHHQICL